MTSFLSRGGSPGTPCPEYAKFQRIAEELVANINEAASPEQCEQVQKSLLFLFQERRERFDPWHLRFPGGHPCLEECYLQYVMRLRNRALRYKPPQPPAAPAPSPQPLSDEELMERLKEYVKESTKETFFGQDQEAEEAEEEEQSS